MKKIYIAGPYSSDKGYKGEDENTMRAAEVASYYLEEGWAVFCPHTMTRDIARNFLRDFTWEDWLATDISWLHCCDAIHMLQGWSQSKGASFEYLVAKGLGLEIYGSDE